jgi:hypothetical protein
MRKCEEIAYVFASVEARHADDEIGCGLAKVVVLEEPLVGLTIGATHTHTTTSARHMHHNQQVKARGVG